jgi:hypothetical protein
MARGRLRIAGAAMALLVVVFGAVTAWQSSDRYASADDVVSRGQTVKDTADLYSALADADTQAATGFLAGATEPAAVGAAYRDDLSRASTLLAVVGENTEPGSPAARLIAQIGRQLPVYSGVIERARAENRRDLPLGGAYLRYANDQMTQPKGILPSAESLYNEETKRLGQESGDAQVWPYVSLALGLIALAVLVWAQRRNYHRTNRVFNRGMLTATAASTAILLWLVAGQAVGNIDLNGADKHGQQSLNALNDARINSLKARADENLTLVSRGSVLAADKKNDKYEVDYGAKMKALSSDLDLAKDLADDSQGGDPVDDAAKSVATWRVRHSEASNANENGDFGAALRTTNGRGETSEQAFATVDGRLSDAIGHEQDEFASSARDGRGALNLLWLGAALLAVVGAVGAILGVGRRLSEYR